MGLTDQKQELLFGHRDQFDVGHRNRGRAARLIVDQRHLAENTVRPELRNGPVADLDSNLAALNDKKFARLVAFLKNNAAGLERLRINIVARQYAKTRFLFHGRPRLTASLRALPDEGPTIVRLAKSGGPGIVLGTEPAIRLRQRGITAACLQVINADIAGNACAQGKLAFDAASRRHCGRVGEKRPTDFGILVGPACPTKQGAVLSPAAEFQRRHKAALPKSPAMVPCIRLVRLELTSS